MRILIANDGPTAFYYIRMGLARAFAAGGHEVLLWDIHDKPAYDAFDEFEPHLFIGQTYNTDRAIVNAIKERPHMKVIMKAGDWGEMCEQIDPEKYGVLMASKDEKRIILDLKEETGKPDYVYIYYHQDFLERTHGGWSDSDIDVHSHMLGADIFDYVNGRRMEEFDSDLTFVGGYWPYKAQNLDRYILKLCENYKYCIKLFGNSHWPVAQYCGYIPPAAVRDALASATICPQIHEPHSNDFGFDTSERTFKLMSNKCFVISDYVEGLEKIFGEDIVMAKNPREFQKLVDHYLANPHERDEYIAKGYDIVMNNHTYFHRAADIFKNLGLVHNNEANELMHLYYNIKAEVDEGKYASLDQ